MSPNTSIVNGCPEVNSASPPADIQQLYLTLFLIYVLVSTFGVIIFIGARDYYGRLRKRSTVLVSISLLGALLAYIVIFLREYVGVPLFPCNLIIVGHYLILPLVIGPMVAKLRVYMHKVRRTKALAVVSFETLRKVQRVLDAKIPHSFQSASSGFAKFVSFVPSHSGVVVEGDEERRAHVDVNNAKPSKIDSPTIESVSIPPYETDGSEGIDTFSVVSPGRVDDSSIDEESVAPMPSSPPAKKLSAQPSSNRTSSLHPASHPSSRKGSFFQGILLTPRPSVLGLFPPVAEAVQFEELVRDDSTIYGVILVLLFSLPFIIALVIRIGTDPTYRNNCRGCEFQTEDTQIVMVLAVIMVVPYLLIMWRTWRAPDPLGIVIEARMTFYLGVMFALPIFVLYMADPGNIQVHLYFSWFTLEATGVLCIMVIQTYAQIFLARKASQIPNSINLLRTLENVQIRPLFEEHLMNEFSVENLRFWDRATRYKMHYDVLLPADRDRIANELFSVFVRDDGAMTLNLSHQNRAELHRCFDRQPGCGPRVNIARGVFDGALKEAYTLMCDGQNRFVKSSTYRQIKRIDLEGDQLRNVELGLDLDSGIDTYLAHLGSSGSSVQRSSSRSTKLADRRVSFMHLVLNNEASGSLLAMASKVNQRLVPRTSAESVPTSGE